jgi:hypothetical protein
MIAIFKEPSRFIRWKIGSNLNSQTAGVEPFDQDAALCRFRAGKKAPSAQSDEAAVGRAAH